MKKLIATILMAAILVGAAGCSDSNNSSAGSPENSSTTEQSSDGGQGTDNTSSAPVISGDVTLEMLNNHPVTSEEFFEWEVDDENSTEDKVSIQVTKYTGTDPIVVIPETIEGYEVTGISRYIFSNESIVTAVKFPKTMISTGTVFVNNKNIKIVDASSVKKLRRGTFHNCANLETIILGDELTTIEGFAVAGCPKVKELYISSNVKEMIYVSDVTSDKGIVLMSDDFTIVGEAGSFIEEWAKENEINFRVK